MAVSIDPQTFVITIPKSDLTLVNGTIYELDTNSFRLELKAWEANREGGITFLKTHIHNTEVTVAGTTYARLISIIPPYSIEFEDGQYTVILKNSNNNIFDVESGILVQNQVQVIPTNAAGLIVGTGGASITPAEIAAAVWDAQKSLYNDPNTMGEAQQVDQSITEQDKLDIADRVWDEATVDHNTVGSMGEAQQSPALNPQEVADAVWDEPTTNHQDPGTTGKALTDAGAGGNPWDTPIPSNPVEGTFGWFITKKLLTFAKWIGLK